MQCVVKTYMEFIPPWECKICYIQLGEDAAKIAAGWEKNMKKMYAIVDKM